MMGPDLAVVPDTCNYCPYRNSFQKACSHPYRQSIIQELSVTEGECPLFPAIRAEAMRGLLNSTADR